MQSPPSSIPRAICILAPYPEGAIATIAREASTRGLLTALITPSRSIARKLAIALRAISQNSLAERMSRGIYSVPELKEVGVALEIMRLVKILTFGRQAATNFMPRYKRLFEEYAQPEIPRNCNVIISMPGACINTFTNRRDLFRVLHQVDTHPRAHNEALRSHYGAHRARFELIAQDVVSQLEEELTLSDLIVVPSNFVKNQMTNSGIPSFKLCVIPYGVNFATFNLISGQRQNRRPNLLFVGQISLLKGIPFLLDSMRRINADLDLVGPVVDKTLLLELPPNVTYRGTTSATGVVAHMTSADALVLPTIADACALVVAEAAACGLPVISTPMNGACELLPKSDLTLVPPGNVLELRRAIQAVKILEPPERENRSQRIRFKAQSSKLRPTIRDWGSYSAEFISMISGCEYLKHPSNPHQPA